MEYGVESGRTEFADLVAVRCSQLLAGSQAFEEFGPDLGFECLRFQP
jgi:hypothetical protein